MRKSVLFFALTLVLAVAAEAAPPRRQAARSGGTARARSGGTARGRSGGTDRADDAAAAGMTEEEKAAAALMAAQAAEIEAMEKENEKQALLDEGRAKIAREENIARMKAETEDLQKKLVELTGKIASADSEIASLEQELKDHDIKVEAAQEAEVQAQIEEAKQKAAELQGGAK
ncbi:MAG: hypothetical protein LBT92_04165 [Rickettsiales bacterium]|nr:hypothetical protein [Rickettsiales bacterium]